MKWVGLQMTLLFLNEQISATTAARCSRCIKVGAFNDTTRQFEKWHWDTARVSVHKPQQPDKQTCAKAAQQMSGGLNNRALSPWKYSINRDDSRFPRDIAVAECLCEGCIINQVERHDYNSVPVLAPLMVLKKTPCPHKPDKYVLKIEFIWIPVACTCVVPTSAK